MSDVHTSNNWMTTAAMAGTSLPTYAQAWQVNSSNDRYGSMFRVKGDCSITHAAVGYDYTAGTKGNYKFQLWPMDGSTIATPDTSGTVLAETASFMVDSTYTVWEQAFTSPYSATAGQTLACILVPVSGVDGSNYTRFYFQGLDVGNASVPCIPGILVSSDGGSSWSSTSSFKNWMPGIGVRTDKNFFLGGTPWIGASPTSSLSATGDKYCNKITLPAGEDIEIHLIGFTFMGFWGFNHNEWVTAGVWDSDAAEVGDSELVIDGAALTSSSDNYTRLSFYLGNPVKMVSGGSYYVGIEYGSGAVQPYRLNMGKTGCGAQDYLPGGPAFGVAQHWDESASAWVNFSAGNDPGRLIQDLIISDMHGGGAGVVATGLGKGDRYRKAPARVKNSRKPGYQVNLGKEITRNNGGYGWNPYN